MGLLQSSQRVQMVVVRVGQSFRAVVDIQQDCIEVIACRFDQIANIFRSDRDSGILQGMTSALAQLLSVPFDDTGHQFSNNHSGVCVQAG